MVSVFTGTMGLSLLNRVLVGILKAIDENVAKFEYKLRLFKSLISEL